MMCQSASQLTFTFSKLIMETLEKGVKQAQVNKKTPERRQWRCSGVFTVNFEHNFG